MLDLTYDNLEQPVSWKSSMLDIWLYIGTYVRATLTLKASLSLQYYGMMSIGPTVLWLYGSWECCDHSGVGNMTWDAL